MSYLGGGLRSNECPSICTTAVLQTSVTTFWIDLQNLWLPGYKFDSSLEFLITRRTVR